MFQVGSLEIHLINDGMVKVDGGGAFGLVPRVLWGQVLPPDEENLIPMALHNLVVRAREQVVVIDTGMGDKLTPKLRAVWRLDRAGDRGLVVGLARLGIRPEDVTLVIDTHLHGDHCAGNTFFDESGQVRPTFPNAEYVVQRREYQDAMRPNERTRATYVPANYEPLAASGQLRLLNREEEELAPGVFGVVTPGHTPGHMGVRFESRGQHALFTCDMATYAVHFERLGWMSAYDVEPLVTLETKRRWQAWAVENEALLIFPHDPQVPAARLAESEPGQRKLVPVPAEYS